MKLKRILLSILFAFTIFSCDAQIAADQFSRGDYLGSVQTTASWLSGGKYASLKSTEQEQIHYRARTIDNFYENVINNSASRTNISNITDAFLIGKIAAGIPEIRNDLVFLSPERSSRLLPELLPMYRDFYLHSSDRASALNFLYKNQMKLKDNGLNRSIYENTYQRLAKYVADTINSYIEVTNLRNEDKLNYLAMINKVYNEFDGNYLNVRGRYQALKKAIDIKKAFKLLDIGKSEFTQSNYKSAISDLTDAIDLFSQYNNNGEFIKPLRDAKLYLENANKKYKEQQAEYYYQKAIKALLYKRYDEGIENLKNVIKILPNYKDAQALLAQYQNSNNGQEPNNGNNPDNNNNYGYLNFRNEKSFDLNINSNTSKRDEAVRRILKGFNLIDNRGQYNYGYQSVDFDVKYNENVSYTQSSQVISNTNDSYYSGTYEQRIKYTEKIYLTPYISINGRYFQAKPMTFINQYVVSVKNNPYYQSSEPKIIQGKKLGKYGMLSQNRERIEQNLRYLFNEDLKQLIR